MRTLIATVLLLGASQFATAGDAEDFFWSAGKTFFKAGAYAAASSSYDRCHSHNAYHCGSCGYTNNTRERYWVEGYYKTVWQEPIYGWSHGCRVVIRPGCYTKVWVPGCWEYRTVTHWYPRSHSSYGSYSSYGSHYDRRDYDRHDRYDRRDYDRHDRYDRDDRHDRDGRRDRH